MISISGPLFAVGLACFFSGLYRASTGARLFENGGNWVLVVLGVAMSGAGFELWFKGLA